VAMYLMFGDYSLEGVKQVSAQRTKEATALIEKHGGKLVAGYAMLGKHDLLLIVELPSTGDAMRVSVGLSRKLGIAFTTASAVTVKEFDKLMA